ncbi:MAG: hypothetical protein JOZ69_02640, partial [Myxococcales bacterium]|nr:hypothetical protein [Myxococcales bacterium]
MLAGVLAACSLRGPASPGANPERQADAEYDLAREYFYKGDPRKALEHCRQAIAHDGSHARALYFASTIHLYFCSGVLELADPDCRLSDAENYARRAIEADDQFREAKNTLG